MESKDEFEVCAVVGVCAVAKDGADCAATTAACCSL